MRALLITLVTGIFGVLASTNCFAAGTADFSGHWILDPASSKLKFTPSSTQTLDISQSGSKLEVVATTGGVKEKHVYTLDGVKPVQFSIVLRENLP